MIDQSLFLKAANLSPADRLELIGALWDTLAHADLPVTEEEKALINARLADAECNPEDESPLSDVKMRLQGRLH
jgi:putative addiction module component (TIGR02574 family)